MKKNVITSLFSWVNPESEPWYVILAWFAASVLCLGLGLGLIAVILRLWGTILN